MFIVSISFKPKRRRYNLRYRAKSKELARKCRVWVKKKCIRPGSTFVIDGKYYVVSVDRRTTCVMRLEGTQKHDLINIISASIGLVNIGFYDKALERLHKGVDYCRKVNMMY